MKVKITTAVLCLLSLSAYAGGEHLHHVEHFSRAPAGIMGDHVHAQGDWMFSYGYMRMHMDGMKDGDDDLSDAQVLNDFMVTPLRMEMEMHMFGAMYAVSDELTLMAMLPWVRKDMDHITRMGVRFTTRSEGVGDIKLGGVYALARDDSRQLMLNLAVSAPSGDIDADDDTPAMRDAQLPYPMQLGSGTWDLLPGMTWTGRAGHYSWGAQGLLTLRLGENDNDYTLGNRAEVSAWGGRRLSSSWSVSLRLRGQAWDELDGDDPLLNPQMVPTANPELQGGRRIDMLAGAALALPAGFYGNSRLAVEAGAPIYENLDGPQMSADWTVNASLQLVF